AGAADDVGVDHRVVSRLVSPALVENEARKFCEVSLVPPRVVVRFGREARWRSRRSRRGCRRAGRRRELRLGRFLGVWAGCLAVGGQPFLEASKNALYGVPYRLDVPPVTSHS